MAKKLQPPASLSLDLDNLWSYLKVHGDPGWEALPSYLDLVVPRFLDMLAQLDVQITVFIVGQDAALAKNQAALQAIAAAGHEIGNHSFHHESWLHLYSEAEIGQEIATAEAAIVQATGQQPQGWRGPGYSCSPTVLRILAERGYTYDASTFPTFLGPLARAYYLMTTKLSPAERAQRQALFGKFADGLQPLNPYEWAIGDRTLIEVPVTTMPIFKIPIHFSYLLYLATFSTPLALGYFRCALWLCQRLHITPSLLLHPTDFLSDEDVPELAFFPAMKLPRSRKLAILRKLLTLLTRQFRVMPIGQQVQIMTSQSQRRPATQLVG
jgi:peptidoglycan-N-acetylglucosamine deacetylase